MIPPYRTYRVSRADKAPLVRFMLESLEGSGCRVRNDPPPDTTPFHVVLDDPLGRPMQMLAYAFRANCKETRNRPRDECRFQIKYGSKTGELQEVWQDPLGEVTTVFCGIDPEAGYFVGADPVLHNPTLFFISLEFKQHDVAEALETGWSWWERRKQTRGYDCPVEVLVAGRAERFFDYILFETAAVGQDQGHRGLLADVFGRKAIPQPSVVADSAGLTSHPLHDELGLSGTELGDLIQDSPRLKTAVRGWTAEVHLQRLLERTPGVTDCKKIEEDGRPDLMVRYRGMPPVLIECKNVLSKLYADGTACVDFQRTRASKDDPCSRYYRRDEFEILAASLHPVSQSWKFRFVQTAALDPHQKCGGRLANRVRVDSRFCIDPIPVLDSVSEGK